MVVTAAAIISEPKMIDQGIIAVVAPHRSTSGMSAGDISMEAVYAFRRLGHRVWSKPN